MKSFLYILIYLCLPPNIISGQSAYYSTDSMTKSGIELVEGRAVINSRFCRVMKGDSIIQYSPYEIEEYGFKNGKVYISKEIQISDSTQRVFLERLDIGKMTLYYYKGRGIRTFFLEKDTSFFMEIPKRNSNNIKYNQQLLKVINDSPNTTDAVRLVSYTKKSLSTLVAKYNNHELRPFPHFRFGLNIGYELNKLKPPKEKNYETNSNLPHMIPVDGTQEHLDMFDYKYNGGFTIGLFVDHPIYVSDFSLHTELNYSRHEFYYYKQIDNGYAHFIANISSLNVPILLRYTYPAMKIRPYINLGGVLAYHIKNENSIYEESLSGNIIDINTIEESSLIEKKQFGLSAGCGIEYILNYKYSLFFELRYNRQCGLADSESLNISLFNFMTGIYF